MSWTGLVPLKTAALRKSRLHPRLSREERELFSEVMARRVIDALHCSHLLTSVILLSDKPLQGAEVEWIQDTEQGLNAEIEKAVRLLSSRPLLIVQGDLPLIGGNDVKEMLEQARGGAAIAPDRHESGTNALALMRPAGFSFSFGAGSLAMHLEALGNGCKIVRRPGLAIDVDTEDDLGEAIQAGFHF